MLSWIQPLIPKAAPLPDWFADARGLTMSELSVFKLMKQLWRSDWGEGPDVISYDAAFEGARRNDERWKDPGPNTYYRSYVCCMVCTVLNARPKVVTDDILYRPSEKNPILHITFPRTNLRSWNPYSYTRSPD